MCIHQNQFRGPATNKNQFPWGKPFCRDEIWANPAFQCWRKFALPVVPSTWLLVDNLQHFSDKRIHLYIWGGFVCFGGVLVSVESHSFQHFEQRLSCPTFLHLVYLLVLGSRTTPKWKTLECCCNICREESPCLVLMLLPMGQDTLSRDLRGHSLVWENILNPAEG